MRDVAYWPKSFLDELEETTVEKGAMLVGSRRSELPLPHTRDDGLDRSVLLRNARRRRAGCLPSNGDPREARMRLAWPTLSFLRTTMWITATKTPSYRFSDGRRRRALRRDHRRS